MNIININSNERILLNNAINKYILETKLPKVTHSEVILHCLNKYTEDQK